MGTMKGGTILSRWDHARERSTTNRRKQIEEYLARPVHELARLEAEITGTQAIVDDLSRERDRVKEFLDVHHCFPRCDDCP